MFIFFLIILEISCLFFICFNPDFFPGLSSVQLFSAHPVVCSVHFFLHTPCGLQCALFSAHPLVCSVHFFLHTPCGLQYALFSAHTLWSVVCNFFCTPCGLQCAIFSAHPVACIRHDPGKLHTP